MCILLNVKKHEKTFALNVDIFTNYYRINYILTTVAFQLYTKTQLVKGSDEDSRDGRKVKESRGR